MLNKLLELLFFSFLAKDNSDNENKDADKTDNENKDADKTDNENKDADKTVDENKKTDKTVEKEYPEHFKNFPPKRIQELLDFQKEHKELERKRKEDEAIKKKDYDELLKLNEENYKEKTTKQIDELKDVLFANSELPEKVKKLITGSTVNEIKESIETFKELVGTSKIEDEKKDTKTNELTEEAKILKAFLS